MLFILLIPVQLILLVVSMVNFFKYKGKMNESSIVNGNEHELTLYYKGKYETWTMVLVGSIALFLLMFW